MSVHESAVLTGWKLRSEWLEANRNPMTEVNVVKKLESAYQSYANLRKSYRRGGDGLWSKVRELKISMAVQFDIGAKSSHHFAPSKNQKRQARHLAGVTRKRWRDEPKPKEMDVDKIEEDADFTPEPSDPPTSTTLQNLDRGKDPVLTRF
ncbi:hypothetical protein ONE63_011393 [Megalurothrips usitatus]|uniref:Uncharacterized protein n=1 Tax=Megalurothrips usitatus TaxID=439358 RepID=A0AAV7X3F7_9NEOP|nr:hypothetical protein ONE63_011393 [Megalurothrips usitatus]